MKPLFAASGNLLFKAAILIIILWNFTVFQYMSHLPQVRQNLTYRITYLIYKSPHEFLKKLRLRKIGNLENCVN